MNQLERLASMVVANQFLTLSTSRDDEPWISPLYFAADKTYKLYFISRRDSRHAENIRSQSNVAVAIFNSTCTPGQCDGVQISGKARELNETNDIAYGATVLFSRRFEDEEQRKKYLDPARYQDKELMRIYEISPKAIFVVDKERPNDYRIQVDM